MTTLVHFIVPWLFYAVKYSLSPVGGAFNSCQEPGSTLSRFPPLGLIHATSKKHLRFSQHTFSALRSANAVFSSSRNETRTSFGKQPPPARALFTAHLLYFNQNLACFPRLLNQSWRSLFLLTDRIDCSYLCWMPDALRIDFSSSNWQSLFPGRMDISRINRFALRNCLKTFVLALSVLTSARVSGKGFVFY